MCYRDRTFCPFSECDNFSTCPEALTDEVQEKADKWWEACKGDAPISTYMDAPECFVEGK